MSWRWLFILSLVGCAKPNYQDALPAGACSVKKNSTCPVMFSQLATCADLTMEQQPKMGGDNSAILTFSKPLPPNTKLEARLWMPAHQHFSAVPRFERLDDTHVRVRRLRFFMLGQWELKINAVKDDTQVDGSNFEICL